MKSFLKMVLLAPIFTVVVRIVIFCGVVFDLCSPNVSASGEQKLH